MINTKFQLGEVIYWCDRAMGEWFASPVCGEISGVTTDKNTDNELFVKYSIRAEMPNGKFRTFSALEEDCFAAYLECVDEVNKRNGRKEKPQHHKWG